MGGKGGHMLHPYEDPELTFQSLIDLFEHTALGGLEGTIKRDGQNLVVSYSLAQDQAVAIRNDDHVFIKGMGLKGEGPEENFADYLAFRSLWAILMSPNGIKQEFTTKKKWEKYLKENKTSPEELQSNGYDIEFIGRDFKSFRNGTTREKKATPPHIIKAFTKAMRDLEDMARAMPEDLVVKLFGKDADFFYNAEVMSPLSRNAIEYGVDTLSLHRILHHAYDDEERELDTMGAVASGERAALLDGDIKDYYGEKGEPGDERNPTPVSVGAMERLIAMEDESIKEDAIQGVKTLALQNGLSLDNSLGRLVFVRFHEAVHQALPRIGPDAEKLLVIRMFQEVYNAPGHSWEAEEILADFGNINLNEEKVSLKAIMDASADRERNVGALIKELVNSSKRFHTKIITPLVNIIFRFSAHALGTLRDLYVLNRDTEIERTRGTVFQTIKNLETLLKPVNSNDPKALEKWEKFLIQRDKFKALEDKISEAEGFVFQWPPGTDNTYKFTGLFAPINQLLGMDPSRWAEGLIYTETLLTEAQTDTVLYLPGGLKPPHKGHFALARDALSQHPGAQLVIMSGESSRGDITLDKARNVWDIYFKSIGVEKNVVVRALEPEYPRDADGNRMRKYVRGTGVRSPMPYLEWKEKNLKDSGLPESDMEALYERAIGIPKNGEKSLVLDDSGNPITVEFMTTSPINSIASAIRFKDKPKRAIIVASSEDPGNATSLAQSLQKGGLSVEPLIVPVRVKDKAGTGKMSATNMRAALELGFEVFEQFLPEELDDQQKREVFTMLNGGLEEASTSAAVSGAPGVPGGPWHGLDTAKANKRQEKISKRTLRTSKEFISEEEEIVNEVVDYLLGITVG